MLISRPDCVNIVPVAEATFADFYGPSGFTDDQGEPVSLMDLYAYTEHKMHGSDGVFFDPTGTRLSKEASEANSAINRAPRSTGSTGAHGMYVALLSRRPDDVTWNNDLTLIELAEFLANTGQTQAA